MTLAFIINSFNRLELLKYAISSIEEFSSKELGSCKIQLIIFDAGSSDGSVEWLMAYKHGCIKVVTLRPSAGEDSSFSAGLNAGVNYAIDTIPDLQYLIFYETDNAFKSFSPILSAIECLQAMEDLAGCGFTVKKHDGTGAGVGMPFPRLINFALGKKIVHYLKLESVPYRWSNVGNEVEFSYVDVVFTSPLVVKPVAWKQAGGLDAEAFPFSDTDIDWAKRLRSLGWRLGVIKSSDVIHDNVQQVSQWSKTRSLNFHRARLKYHLRYSGMRTYGFWPVILLTRHIFEYIACSFIKDGTRRMSLKSSCGALISRCLKKYESQ